MLNIDSDILEYHVSILSDNDFGEVYLVVSYDNIIIIDDVFHNPLKASATLRDAIGFGPAKDLLVSSNVPRSHPIWDLNHSDLWER